MADPTTEREVWAWPSKNYSYPIKSKYKDCVSYLTSLSFLIALKAQVEVVAEKGWNLESQASKFS